MKQESISSMQKKNTIYNASIINNPKLYLSLNKIKVKIKKLKKYSQCKKIIQCV